MKRRYIHLIQEQLKASYSAIADEFDATRQKPWEEFHHFLGYVRHGSQVLDLGCGNGRLYGALAGRGVDYLGVDHNSQLLEKAQAAYPEARFALADMMDLHFLPEEAFDTVFCVAAFHHIPGRSARREVLEQIHRALKPDGVLIFTVWNLFQWKYVGALLKSIVSWALHLGLKYAWNDLWIQWGNYPIKRYYHAFLPSELRRYFENGSWEIEEFYFTRKGARVGFWRSFNLVVIARKK